MDRVIKMLEDKLQWVRKSIVITHQNTGNDNIADVTLRHELEQAIKILKNQN